MKKKNTEYKPLYFKNKEEMNQPLATIMEDLRNDLSKIRGKIWDIKKAYGWEDRIEHLEGGLTCMLVAMYAIKEEWEEFERVHNI